MDLPLVLQLDTSEFTDRETRRLSVDVSAFGSCPGSGACVTGGGGFAIFPFLSVFFFSVVGPFTPRYRFRGSTPCDSHELGNGNLWESGDPSLHPLRQLYIQHIVSFSQPSTPSSGPSVTTSVFPFTGGTHSMTGTLGGIVGQISRGN